MTWCTILLLFTGFDRRKVLPESWNKKCRFQTRFLTWDGYLNGELCSSVMMTFYEATRFLFYFYVRRAPLFPLSTLQFCSLIAYEHLNKRVAMISSRAKSWGISGRITRYLFWINSNAFQSLHYKDFCQYSYYWNHLIKYFEHFAHTLNLPQKSIKNGKNGGAR